VAFPLVGRRGQRWRLWARPQALLLPAMSLAAVQAAILKRDRLVGARSDARDYVRTARAKGLSRRAVLWRTCCATR